jgi:hypothetical protein
VLHLVLDILERVAKHVRVPRDAEGKEPTPGQQDVIDKIIRYVKQHPGAASWHNIAGRDGADAAKQHWSNACKGRCNLTDAWENKINEALRVRAARPSTSCAEGFVTTTRHATPFPGLKAGRARRLSFKLFGDMAAAIVAAIETKCCVGSVAGLHRHRKDAFKWLAAAAHDCELFVFFVCRAKVYKDVESGVARSVLKVEIALWASRESRSRRHRSPARAWALPRRSAGRARHGPAPEYRAVPVPKVTA